MGFSLSTLRFIARQHARQPLGPAVCTLGRQRVVATYDQVVVMLRDEGICPQPLPSSVSLTTNIPSWRGTPNEFNTSDAVFFKLLGVEALTAIDVSDYEGADVICDLNRPIHTSLRERFDTVIDSGTIEHVHDVHMAIRNANALARPGGTVIHVTPTSNYIDHGYHQLSPIFFIDYYAANRFRACDAWLFEHVRPFSTIEKWKLYKHVYGRPVAPFNWMWSRSAWGTAIVAVKGQDSTVDAVPIQGSTAFPWSEQGPRPSESHNVTIFSPMRKRLEPLLRRHPWLWKLAVRSFLVSHRILRMNPSRHPYIGRV